jgi:hypothetical protein
MKRVLLGVGMLVAVFAFTKAASAATLTLSPASGTYNANDNFTVNVNLDTTGQAIDGVDLFYLKFNPSILQVVDANGSASGVQITPGSLLPQTLSNTADNSTGKITFSQVTTGGTTYTGSGILASITFKAAFNGTSSLTFDFTPGSTADTNVAGGGVDKLTSVNSASFTVTGGVVNPNPTPTPVPTPTPTPTPTPIPPPPSGYGVDPTKYPNGMFVKYAADPTVFILNGGTKYPITDWTVYQNRVPTSRFIITIPDSVTFPTGAIVGLRSGTLIKASNNATVYLFDGTNRLAFTSQTDFLSLGYKFNQVYVINDVNLFNTYPVININKPTFSRPQGTLFKYANNPTIYFLDNGTKRAFTSMFMFKAWYDRLDQIITVPDTETYANASTYVLLPNGAIVRPQNTSNYYVIADTVVRPLNYDYMLSLGVQASQYLTVSQDDLDRHGTIGAEWR